MPNYRDYREPVWKLYQVIETGSLVLSWYDFPNINMTEMLITHWDNPTGSINPPIPTLYQTLHLEHLPEVALLNIRLISIYALNRNYILESQI